MSYWKNTYGTRSNEFIEGVIAGITHYAVWKNGREVVGVRERPLKVVISEIKHGLGWKVDDVIIAEALKSAVKKLEGKK